MCECLEVDSVLKQFSNHVILADIYLRCCPGDIIGLFGRNGTGKSTLLNIIFGTLDSDRSFIRINGKIQNFPAFRSGLIAYLPQHNYLPQRLSITEIVNLCIRKEDKDRFLEDEYLYHIKDSTVKELSGGEQRYLEIKLILFSPANYILLDEPFNGLSPISAESIRKHITTASRTKGVILTDHNFREVYKVINRIMLLDQCCLKEIQDKQELTSYGYTE